MSIDFENSLDGVVDWIEDKLGGEGVKSCPERKVEQKRMEIPVPDIRAVTKAMRMTDGEKLQQAVDCMRQLLITARYQISQLEEKNRKLESRLESDCVVRCPACCFAHKTKGNRFFPSYIKAIQSTCTLELTFKTKEDLLSFMVASQLDSDQNGVPVLTPTVKPIPKGLGEAGSQLTNLILEKEKENAKVKIALRKKDDVTSPVPPTDFSSLSTNSTEQDPPNKSIHKLIPITNKPRTEGRPRDETKGIDDTRRDSKPRHEYRPVERTGSKKAVEERPRNDREQKENTSRTGGLSFRTGYAHHTLKKTSNNRMTSSREETVAIERRDYIHPQQTTIENKKIEKINHRERDAHYERDGRTRTERREAVKRRCSPVRERSKRRPTPEKGRRRELERRKEGERDRRRDSRRDRPEDSRNGTENRRDGSSRRTSPEETAGKPEQITYHRGKIEAEAPFKCSNSYRQQNGGSTNDRKHLVAAAKASTLTDPPTLSRTLDDALSEGELIDDELEEIDSDEENKEETNVEKSQGTGDKSAEDDLVEDEDMNWFGEVVSDDNDVLGENYESASEDDTG